MWSFKADESIEFMKEHEPEEGYVVNFSGGKDSIVMYDLVKKGGIKIKEVAMAHTFIEPPELYQFIRKHYPEVKKYYPKMTLWQGIMKNGFPSPKARWCCNVLKKEPLNITGKHDLLGLRSEESFGRSQRPRVNHYKKDKIKYSPIFYWNEGDIWEYIEENGLAYPSLYDEGFSRIGCVICPMATQGRLMICKERWPYFFTKARQVMGDWIKKKEDAGVELRIPRDVLINWPIFGGKFERRTDELTGTYLPENRKGV